MENLLEITRLSSMGLPLPKELLDLATANEPSSEGVAATASATWDADGVSAPAYDGRKHLWLYEAPHGKDDPCYWEKIPQEWKDEAALLTEITPAMWKPPGAPEKLPADFLKWCLSINPRFDEMIPYKPFYLFCEAARRWNLEPGGIEQFAEGSQEWIDYGLREMKRCSINRLYGLDRYITITDDSKGGRRKYSASTPQAMIAYMESILVSTIIKKGRHAAITSTFNASDVFDLMLMPSFKGALITDDVGTTAKNIFLDKFVPTLKNMPKWFRPSDEFGHYAHEKDEKIILQFGKKKGGKADKKMRVSSFSLVSGKDTQAVNGLTLTKLRIDEAQNVANVKKIIEERRPQMWAEVDGMQRLVRMNAIWGTGNANGKNSAEFDDLYQQVKQQMIDGVNTGGMVALFFDGFCRPGVDKEHYYTEWQRVASGSDSSSKDKSAQDQKLIFASRFPLTDDDATAQNSDSILPMHVIKSHKDRIITKLRGRIRRGRFEEIPDMDKPMPPGSDWPFFIKGVRFIEGGADNEILPVTMLFDREEGCYANYYQGTDPIQSFTGRSKMASNILAASALHYIDDNKRQMHVPASVCWVNMRHPNPVMNYKQCKLMGMYYANEGERACKELVEFNQGHDYVRFCESPAMLCGESIIHNYELPSIYQDSGNHPGLMMTSMSKGHVHADIIRFNDECGHNEYSLEYYNQLSHMVQGETNDGKIKFGTVDVEKYNDDLVFAKTFSYIAMKMSYEVPRRKGKDVAAVDTQMRLVRDPRTGNVGYVQERNFMGATNFAFAK